MKITSERDKACFAQVGFSFNNISLIGVPIHRRSLSMKTPRIVILEPENDANKYDQFHTRYQEFIDKTKQELNIGEVLRLVRGDIYESESLVSLSPIAFLVLENVLSDPFYQGEKDYNQLVTLIQKVIINGGVILTLDSKLSVFEDEVRILIQNFLSTVLAGGNFSVLLNLLEFEWGEEHVEKRERDSDQVVRVTIAQLEQFGLVDDALKQGLETLTLGTYHCLVLQKNSNI